LRERNKRAFYFELTLAVDTQAHHDVRVPYHRVANDVLSGRQVNRSHLNWRNERDTTHLVNPHAAGSSHGNRAQRYDEQANA
jgi:hypothetical protein